MLRLLICPPGSFLLLLRCGLVMFVAGISDILMAKQRPHWV